MSLERSSVPDAMTLFLYTKQNPENHLVNYRPMSLLSNLSKVLEKVVYRRLYSFLTYGKVLYERQFGFRPMMSTIDTMTDFITYVQCTSLFG